VAVDAEPEDFHPWLPFGLVLAEHTAGDFDFMPFLGKNAPLVRLLINSDIASFQKPRS
jgi:hypothetical protein